jgi:hypothetical protein
MPQIRKAIKESKTGAFDFAMGRVFHKERPLHVQQIGACLMVWPELETQMAILLSHLLKAGAETTLAVFLSLRRSTARTEAVSVASEVGLNAQGHEYICGALKVIQAAEAERNALAHAAWGYTHLIEDGIVWISENDSVHFHANANKALKTNRAIDFRSYYKGCYVYTMKDLIFVEHKIDEALGAIYLLKNYVDCYYQLGECPQLRELSEKLETYAPMKEALRPLRERDLQKICEHCSQPIRKAKGHPKAPL